MTAAATAGCDTPPMRTHAASASPLEPTIGFSRAVRCGPLVCVAGTAPIGADGRTVSPGDVEGQTRRCFARSWR